MIKLTDEVEVSTPHEIEGNTYEVVDENTLRKMIENKSDNRSVLYYLK